MDTQIQKKPSFDPSKVEMHAVASGNILRRGYDTEHKILVVQFRRKKKNEDDSEDGSTYTYENVTTEIWHRWVEHPNATDFFNQHIKAFPNVFPYKKIS